MSAAWGSSEPTDPTLQVCMHNWLMGCCVVVCALFEGSWTQGGHTALWLVVGSSSCVPPAPSLLHCSLWVVGVRPPLPYSMFLQFRGVFFCQHPNRQIRLCLVVGSSSCVPPASFLHRPHWVVCNDVHKCRCCLLMPSHTVFFFFARQEGQESHTTLTC